MSLENLFLAKHSYISVGSMKCEDTPKEAQFQNDTG